MVNTLDQNLAKNYKKLVLGKKAHCKNILSNYGRDFKSNYCKIYWKNTNEDLKKNFIGVFPVN